jgi:hypothetical protein
MHLHVTSPYLMCKVKPTQEYNLFSFLQMSAMLYNQCRMNTKAIIGLIVLIIIGVGAYFVWGKMPGGTYGPTSTVPVGGGSQSIQQLVGLGKSVTCTFATTTASGSQQGTIYVSNGMVAGDFTANVTGGSPIDAHMIVRDNTSYVWTSATNQGFKSTVAASSTGTGTGQGLDYSAQMNYECKSWNADSSKFNLPTNISFMSTAAYTQPDQGAGATGAAGAGVKGTAAQCAQCNTLSGSQKAQCLAALSC